MTALPLANIALDDLLLVARQAGDCILRYYTAQNVTQVQTKADKTPVTAADIAANQLIIDALTQLTPDIPILSEESVIADYSTRQTWQQYWLVDPLDGTKEFIAANDEFTVNIALIQAHSAVLGVVYAPAKKALYWADASGAYVALNQAAPRQLRGNPINTQAVRVISSRRHSSATATQILEQSFGSVTHLMGVGSSLKFCLLADGKADIYPRLGPTSEWDTAAAHAILQAVGGEIYQLTGEPLRYNTKESLLNPYFIAIADASFDWPSLLAQWSVVS